MADKLFHKHRVTEKGYIELDGEILDMHDILYKLDRCDELEAIDQVNDNSDMSDKKVNVTELLEKEVEAFKIIASFARLKESVDKGDYNDCKRVKSIMKEIVNK